MSSLDHVKSVIVVFVMPGCPACEDYKPRFEHQVNTWIAHGVPMYWYQSGNVPKGKIPVLVLNGTSRDPGLVSLADQYSVEAMPTTLLLTRNARPVKLEGALDDEQIYEVLHNAALANR